MVLMPGFQSTRLATEGALEPFFFLYTDDSIQGNPETCKQSSITLNYEVKNNQDKMDIRSFKGILRDYNAGKLELPDTEAEKPGCAGKSSETGYRDDDPALIRDCSYYETSTRMEVG